MPVSRLISDLDHLNSQLNVDGDVAPEVHDELRLTVARIKELRRQLDIAQFKLDTVISLAGKKNRGRKLEPEVLSGQYKERFKIPNDQRTSITEIDEAHRAMYQAGNRLYWLVLLREVNTTEAETALTRLIICVKTAFAIEEQMMAASHYSELDKHRVIHQRMKNYLAEMHDLVLNEPLAVVVKLEKFLGSWFPWHLQVNDIEFSKSIATGFREAPEEPVIETEGSNHNAPNTSKCETSVTDASTTSTGFQAVQSQLTTASNKSVDEPGAASQASIEAPRSAGDRSGRNPVRELGYVFRGLLSSWLLRWREKRHVVRSCRAILSHYRSISTSQPHLMPKEIYCFVVMAYTDCDTKTASQILSRAEESFAEWPVPRDINLRDVVHYLAVTEYFDLYGKDFWMRSEIGNVVNKYIPHNI